MADIDTEFDRFKNSRFCGYFDLFLEEINELEKQGIKVLFFQTPLKQNIDGLSDFERKRLSDWEFDFNHISEHDCEIIKQIYPPEVTVEYLRQVYDGSNVYEANGIKYLADFQSEYVNVINGKRVTYYQPDVWEHTIYIYGQCTARGTGVEDKHTIASFLQMRINQQYADKWRVVNMAVGCGSDLYDDVMHMKSTHFLGGDIVVLCTNLEIVPVQLFAENHISYYDTSGLFSSPHSHGEWFTDMTFHTNAKGNEVIAGYIYCILEESDMFVQKGEKGGRKSPVVIPLVKKEAWEGNVPEELSAYINTLSTKKRKGKNGCIVMNCNPFTKGHRYLIEYAAKQVDNLYVFVVEEDASFFPFEDRIALVKQGTNHLDNVEVSPSGKFMISAYTFPGYFTKDGNKEIEVDVSKDVMVFGKYIAPALGVTVRFVGEEPNDFVTRKYNEEMKEVLPEYGIELKVIPRKKQNGRVISASMVRALLQEKEFSQIKELVPLSTYEYLRERFNG